MYQISVIIPIYNMEKYLKFCLETVQKQTVFHNLEVICVNDGSSDHSLDILNEYALRFKNIVIINQKNAGVGIARNNGIKAASGEFIAFMDPDDYYLERDTLELLYSKAKENNVLICGGSLSEDHNNGKWIRKEFEGIYHKFVFKNEELIQYKDYQFDFGFYRFIYNRKFLIENEIFFPPLIRFQDPPFFVHAMIKAKEFYAVPDYTYCYRYGHQNLIWHEERICALIKGHIQNLEMSSAAGLDELHMLTLHRLFEISGGLLIQGLVQESKRVWELLEEAEASIDQTILSEKEKDYSIRQFIFDYCKEAEESKRKLVKLNKELESLKRQSNNRRYDILLLLKKIKRFLRR